MQARTERGRSSSGRGAVGGDDIVDIAVVGGGVVGATAALAAGQAGLSVLWVAGDTTSSSPADTTRDLRVYALGPSTQRFLERLRIWLQLDAARMAPVLDMQIFGDAARGTSLHFDAYEAATERLATIVEHRELARVLNAAAAFFPGIERVDGLASTIDVAADAVTLTTASGPRRARLLVAADGATSAMRTALGIGVQGRPYHQRAIVGNFRIARPHGGTAFQWFTVDGVVALLPLAATAGEPDAMSLVWSAPDALAGKLMTDGPDALAARLSTLCTGIRTPGGRAIVDALPPLTSAGPLASIPLQVQWAERTIADRAVLVGDAAHVIHPLAGQGLNLGFGDVESLVDVLAARESFRDCGDRVLLRRHERRRAEPVDAMRRMTDGLQRLFASHRRDVVAVRDIGLRLVDHAGPLKRLLMRQAAGAPIDG